MMRAIALSITLLIALVGSTSVVSAMCTEVPVAKSVNVTTPGYQPVLVYIHVPADEELKKAETPLQSTMRFWIEGSGIAYDVAGNIVQMHRCEAGPREARTQKTYLKIRQMKLPDPDDPVYVFRGGVLLPTALVAAKVKAGVTLPSDTELSGEWGSETIEGRTYTTLTLKPIE
jgi:hypothetical protein